MSNKKPSKKPKKPSPFDYVKSISGSTVNEIESGALSGNDMSVYMVLRALSYFPDTVLFADAFNGSNASPENVYHALHSLVQPKINRFAKWKKFDPPYQELLLEQIMQYYECGSRDAFMIARQLEAYGTLEEFKHKYDNIN